MRIDQVCSKASRGLNLLRRLAWLFPRSALVCFYNAYVFPHLMYAAPVWSSCTKAQSTKLEGLQNFAARIVLHHHGYTSATSMRKELGWLTLLSRRILGETVILHRCLSDSAPDYLSSLLKPTSSVHSHMTRSPVTKGLQVSRIHTEFGRKTFAFAQSPKVFKSHASAQSLEGKPLP